MATMNPETIKDQIEELQDALNSVHEALLALNLKQKDASISTYCETERLDPIGKAKMLIGTAYAIDSLLFCYLKLSGIRTESHTILNELDRVKQYVGKIKLATAHETRKLGLDKKAASRMIEHNLASNAAQDRQRALQTAQTNKMLEEKLAESVGATVGKHTRFQNSGIMQEPIERLHTGMKASVPAESDDSIDLTASVDNTQAQSGSKITANPGMFEETKAERKARERRERKSAKRQRHHDAKARKVVKSGNSAPPPS